MKPLDTRAELAYTPKHNESAAAADVVDEYKSLTEPASTTTSNPYGLSFLEAFDLIKNKGALKAAIAFDQIAYGVVSR